MTRLRHALLSGAAAGAAGTTVLNAVTYLDMAIRGRPASDTPQRSVERMAQRAGVEIPGQGDERANRLAGLGPLTGSLTGVGVGAMAALLPGRRHVPTPFMALLIGGAAMASTDLSMARLGVSDPAEWDARAWAADLVPHLAYGAATAAVLSSLGRQR